MSRMRPACCLFSCRRSQWHSIPSRYYEGSRYRKITVAGAQSGENVNTESGAVCPARSRVWFYQHQCHCREGDVNCGGRRRRRIMRRSQRLR